LILAEEFLLNPDILEESISFPMSCRHVLGNLFSLLRNISLAQSITFNWLQDSATRQLVTLLLLPLRNSDIHDSMKIFPEFYGMLLKIYRS